MAERTRAGRVERRKRNVQQDFQGVVLQMKECTDRVVGVIDEQGTVVSCNELTRIGEKWGAAAVLLSAEADSQVTSNGFTFKALSGWNGQLDYAAFVRGEDEQAALDLFHGG